MSKRSDKEQPCAGRVFIRPVEIYYYEVLEAEFQAHPESGCMMPLEKCKIARKLLYNAQELVDWWIRKEDWNYPIPVELQLFLSFANIAGLYEEGED